MNFRVFSSFLRQQRAGFNPLRIMVRRYTRFVLNIFNIHLNSLTKV